MLDFTWRVFSSTGNIDTYLLFKELELDHSDKPEMTETELAETDFPIF